MKSRKTFLCAALAAAVLAGNSSALAANTTGKADFWLHPMYVSGYEAHSWNPEGQETYFLSYNGTIYVQLRTVAEWIGKEVAWDADTNTISLSGNLAPIYRDATTIEYAELMNKYLDEDEEYTEFDRLIEQGTTVTERPDITVTIDGAAKSLTDASGKTICPITYNGTNYLPLRAVAEILNMQVTYLPQESRGGETVFLRPALPDADLAACKSYVDTLSAQFIFAGMGANNLNSLEECRAQAVQCREAMLVLRDTAKPNVSLLDHYYEKMTPLVNEAITTCDNALAAINSGASLDEVNRMLHNGSSTSLSVVDACTAPFASVNGMRLVVYQSWD